MKKISTRLSIDKKCFIAAKLKTRQRRISTAFTLIELLVVIVIIGILATISVAQFRGFYERGRDAKRAANVNTISKLIKAHYTAEATGTNDLYVDMSATKLSEIFSAAGWQPEKVGDNICYFVVWDDVTEYSVQHDTSSILDIPGLIVSTYGITTSTAAQGVSGVLTAGHPTMASNFSSFNHVFDKNYFVCQNETIEGQIYNNDKMYQLAFYQSNSTDFSGTANFNDGREGLHPYIIIGKDNVIFDSSY